MENKRGENSLRLGDRELKKLSSMLESGTPSGARQREHVRWSFCQTSTWLTIDHPGGSRQTLVVATRNLSRRGIGLLHSSYMYPGTRAEVTFVSGDGTPIRVTGEITRCVHVSGRVHEIGVRFDDEISIRDVLGLDPMLEAYSLEQVEPGSLHGRVLIVAGSEFEQQLIVKMLEQTSLDLQIAHDIERSCEKARDGCDLVVCDSVIISGEDGVDLVAALRSSGYDAPVIVIGSGSCSATRDDLRMVGANGYLGKPLNASRMLQAVGEFLIADGDGGPLYSNLGADNPMSELIGAFMRELPGLTLQVEKAMRDDNLDMALGACRTLGGSGSPLGFGELTDLALRAERALTESGSLRGGGSDLRALLIACRRVKHRPAG
ncbi:MAG: response regulator [Planctomycetota bacterium]